MPNIRPCSLLSHFAPPLHAGVGTGAADADSFQHRFKLGASGGVAAKLALQI